MLDVQIDQKAGYCFGVEFAIEMAEDTLAEDNTLYCLGDIVHNDMEVERLNRLGLVIINHDDLKEIKDAKVLIRAHGEPPSTYQIALENNLELIDASCPVVMKLQNRVRDSFDSLQEKEGQLVIFGKHGHAEVLGLNGQTSNQSIVISSEEELTKLDFNRPITLYSQTTKSTVAYYKISEIIRQKVIEAQGSDDHFLMRDSICRQVSNRAPQLEIFSQEKDVIVFVSGIKSSNGKSLYSVCKSLNERSYFIQQKEDVKEEWFKKGDKVGISGATSTPMWLMEEVAKQIQSLDF